MVRQKRNQPQAFRQAPWRTQRQLISLFFSLLVGFSVVASVYVIVTSQAAKAGRIVQALWEDMLILREQIADMETQLAELRSTAVMKSRAEAMGFRPATSDDIVYLTVPGYQPRQPVELAPLRGPAQPVETMPRSYTESWIQYVFRMINISTGSYDG
ncbi:MAG: hypothetical protein AB1345_07720 [Chloroflexota bacterium]